METTKVFEVVTEELMDMRLICTKYKCMFPSWYLPGALFLGDYGIYNEILSAHTQGERIGSTEARDILHQRRDALMTDAFIVEVTDTGFLLPEKLWEYLAFDNCNDLRMLKIVLQGKVFYYLMLRQNQEYAKWLMKFVFGPGANYEFLSIKSVKKVEVQAKKTVQAIKWERASK